METAHKQFWCYDTILHHRTVYHVTADHVSSIFVQVIQEPSNFLIASDDPSFLGEQVSWNLTIHWGPICHYHCTIYLAHNILYKMYMFSCFQFCWNMKTGIVYTWCNMKHQFISYLFDVCLYDWNNSGHIGELLYQLIVNLNNHKYLLSPKLIHYKPLL